MAEKQKSMEEQIKETKSILYWHVGAVNCTDEDFERCAKAIVLRHNKQTEDMVQIVRCKNCIWRQHLEPSGGFHHNGESVVYCMLNRRPTREDGYCNAGMRG